MNIFTQAYDILGGPIYQGMRGCPGGLMMQ